MSAETKAPPKREYALLLARSPTADFFIANGDRAAVEHLCQLADDTEKWLNERAAKGFRLVRAESDANGAMWLVMERQT